MIRCKGWNGPYVLGWVIRLCIFTLRSLSTQFLDRLSKESSMVVQFTLNKWAIIHQFRVYILLAEDIECLQISKPKFFYTWTLQMEWTLDVILFNSMMDKLLNFKLLQGNFQGSQLEIENIDIKIECTSMILGIAFIQNFCFKIQMQGSFLKENGLIVIKWKVKYKKLHLNSLINSNNLKIKFIRNLKI